MKNRSIEYMIDTMNHFKNGGEVEDKAKNVLIDKWTTNKDPDWNWEVFDYRKKEYKYPIWFENIQDPTVLVKFTGLNTGVLLRCRSDFYNADKIDIECSDWTSHTVYKVWKQVDEPNLTDKEEK